jgi:hypothetical protein
MIRNIYLKFEVDTLRNEKSFSEKYFTASKLKSEFWKRTPGPVGQQDNSPYT